MRKLNKTVNDPQINLHRMQLQLNTNNVFTKNVQKLFKMPSGRINR